MPRVSARPAGQASEGQGIDDSGDVALLVDWENFKASLGEMNIAPNVTALYEASRRYGRVVVGRAYADWREAGMTDDPPALYRAGLEPVYVPKHKISKEGESIPGIVKNSVDVRMSVEAATLCHMNTNIHTFVLVSGDQDFLHVVNALRPRGRKLIIIGVKETLSQHLSEFVDEVLYYERDIVRSTPVDQPTETDEMPKEKEVFEAIVDILEKSKTPGVALFSYIGAELTKRFPRFHPRVFKYRTFRALIEAALNKGHIEGIATQDLEDWAYLKGYFPVLQGLLHEQTETKHQSVL